jgi:hypothetical protein
MARDEVVCLAGATARLAFFALCVTGAGWGAPPVEVELANPGFEQDLGDEWERASDGGGVFARDPAVAHTGGGSARAERTVGWAGFFTGWPRMVPVQPGAQLKLAAFVRLQAATGQTYLSLDGYHENKFVRILAQSPPQSGTTAGWMRCTVIATVPADGSVTRLRAGLRSEGNQGTAWFDDVGLWRLPPDVPEDTGPPGPPPRGKITVAGAHLVGEDGGRVRLWGAKLWVGDIDIPFPPDASARGSRRPSATTHALRRWGWGPAQLARPGARIQLGRNWHWRLRDFALQVHGEGAGSVLAIAPGTPVYCVDLWQPGAPNETPGTH